MASARCLLNSLKQFQNQSLKTVCMRKPLQCQEVLVNQAYRQYTADAQAAPVAVEKWDLFGAVCLERPAIITTEKTEMEVKFSNMMSQIDEERCMISRHEMRHEADRVYLEEIKKAQEEEDFSKLDFSRQTAVEAEDLWDIEFNDFKPASRITLADEAEDKRSLDRQLDKKLVLIVKEKLGLTSKWCFPQCLWQEGESLRRTARRALKSKCGEDVKQVFLGNAPCGFFKYLYPKAVGKEARGSKIFFFKAIYKEGDIVLNDEESDYLWVTKSELRDYLHKDYLKDVSPFILDI